MNFNKMSKVDSEHEKGLYDMKTFQADLENIIDDQQSISALSLEVEKVLKFYEEHPNYPLDVEKVRSKLLEVYSRINKSISDLQKIQSKEASVKK